MKSMLAKEDLIAIQGIVQAEIKVLIKTEIKPISRSVKELQKDMKSAKRDIRTIIEVFDDKDRQLERRVERLEEKVGV
jgi:uncharacterized coiled-coil protein SlyX